MKKITLMAALLGSAYFANAQVGIGTPEPSKSSMLHIKADDKGVVIPNVSLTSTKVYAPIVKGQGDTETRSLLVYNITTSADTTTATAVTPGFYYWENSEWQRITTKAELDAAVGNVTNVQADLTKIKDLLQFAYPANNLDTNTTADTSTTGGGMIFTPATGDIPAKIEYVYFNGTSYDKVDITNTIGDLIKTRETETTIVNFRDKQYYLSESFTGDTNTANWTVVPSEAILIDVVGGVVNNFNEILDGTTTYNGDTLTVKQIIEQIAAAGGGNMIYIPGADTNTLFGSSFIYTKPSGDTETISFTDLVRTNETVTTLTGDSITGVYTYKNEADSETVIDIPASVVNNFTQILGDTTTYNNTELTIKEIIKQIASEASGNMTFIPGADSSTLLSEAKFQYLDTATNTIVTKTFKELIQATETLTSLTGNSSTGEISYKPESGDTQTVDIVEMVVNNLDEIIKTSTTIDSSTTTLVDYIQNMIDSSTVGGGNVYYGNVDSSTNVLYTQEGDSKTVIDVVSTVINNTTLTGDTNTNVAITNNINKLKNNLGTVLNGDTTTNTSVFTGDTYVENGVTYYIYKGVFATTVNGGTAVTTGINVDKAVKQILSISLNYNNGLTASVTDVTVGSSNPINIGMNIGVGKMYNVLDTADISAKVMVEFASAVKPAGL